MRGLLPIGTFAERSGLSVKALRHYDAQGLLRPAFVDAGTRRRFYAISQLAEARLILRLRALDVPLGEIAPLLAARDAPAIRDLLASHRARLREEIDRRAAALAALDDLMERDASAARYTVEVREQPSLHLLAAGMRTTQERMAQEFGAIMARVVERLDELGESASGPPLTRYLHRGAFQPSDVRAEVALPVARPLPGARGVVARELAPTTVAWTLHPGPYTGLDHAYAALQEGMARRGLTPAGAPLETYLVGLDRARTPEELRTEIAQPLA